MRPDKPNRRAIIRSRGQVPCVSRRVPFVHMEVKGSAPLFTDHLHPVGMPRNGLEVIGVNGDIWRGAGVVEVCDPVQRDIGDADLNLPRIGLKATG
jgi:hypothetical protein